MNRPRMLGEDFKEYRKRLKSGERKTKDKLKPKLLWDCMRGTYVRSRHSASGDVA